MPRPPRQTQEQRDDRNDQAIVDLRLNLNSQQSDLKYLKTAQDASDKRLERVEGKVDIVLDSINKFQYATVGELDTVDKKVDEVEKRVTAVEAKSKPYFRAADIIVYTLAVAAIGAIATFILKGGLNV